MNKCYICSYSAQEEFRSISLGGMKVDADSKIEFGSVGYADTWRTFIVCRQPKCYVILLKTLLEELGEETLKKCVREIAKELGHNQTSAVGPNAPGSPGCCNDVNR